MRCLVWILAAACQGGGKDGVDDTDPPETDETDTEDTDETDTEDTDVSDTDVPAPCAFTVASTLPGASLAPGAAPCRLSVAEADAGVDVPYTLTLDAATHVQMDRVGCGGTDPSGLRFAWTLTGPSGAWCPRCDEGLCVGGPVDTTANVGAWPDTFRWRPRQWSGPSDFGAQPGELLPPGDYTLSIRASGTLDDATPWELSITAPVTLTP